MIWSFIGPIISGLSLVWAVYAFFIKKRDEDQKKEQGLIYLAINSQKAQLEKELYDLRAKLEKSEAEVLKMKLSLVGLISQSKVQTKSFEDTVGRWEKTLDRHEQKLDNFGKVIIKDK